MENNQNQHLIHAACEKVANTREDAESGKEWVVGRGGGSGPSQTHRAEKAAGSSARVRWKKGTLGDDIHGSGNRDPRGLDTGVPITAGEQPGATVSRR